jgi:hypothetical protein
MANTLRIKRRPSAGGPGAPSTLKNAELAFNENTDILYYGKGDDGSGNATSIITIAGSGSYVDLSSNQSIGGIKTFTGTISAAGAAAVSVPTVATATNDTNAASTAFVRNAITSYAVTSVGLSLPGIFNVTTSTVTTTGTLTAVFNNQTANTVFAGPGSGSAAAPTFRSLVANDIPTLTASKISDFDTQVRTNRLDQMAAPLADVSMNGFKITQLGTPTESTDAVTKAYADAIAQSLNVHAAADYATTTAVSYPYVSGGTALTITTITGTDTITFSANHGLLVNSQVRTGDSTTGTGLSTNTTYYVTAVPALNQVKVSAVYGGPNAVLTNGSGLAEGVIGNPGVAATLTGTPNVVDSGSTLVLNQRILVKNHTTSAYNGIYAVSTVGTGSNGVWTRTTDFDNFTTGEIASGDFLYVTFGTVNGGNGFVQTQPSPIRMGVSGAGYTTFTGDAILFTQFSGAGQITAGAGLSKSGNTLDVNVATGRTVINGSDQVDLATVSQTDTTGSDGLSFIQSQTIDSYGRTTGTVTASVRAGSTSQTGVLQLTDSTSSTSTTTAATPNSVKSAYDLGSAALPRAGGTMTGTINLPATTTSLVPFNFAQSVVDPSSPVDGDLWVNSDLFKYYNGSATKTFAFTDSNITGNAANVTGIVAAINGGTGLSSYTTGDLVYASSSTTLATLADVATGNALISGGIGAAPSWGKIGLTTHVSGILALANGGTGSNLSTSPSGTIFKTNGTNFVAAVAGSDYLNDASTIDGGTF